MNRPLLLGTCWYPLAFRFVNCLLLRSYNIRICFAWPNSIHPKTRKTSGKNTKFGEVRGCNGTQLMAPTNGLFNYKDLRMTVETPIIAPLIMIMYQVPFFAYMFYFLKNIYVNIAFYYEEFTLDEIFLAPLIEGTPCHKRHIEKLRNMKHF